MSARTVVAALDPFAPQWVWLHDRRGQIEALTLDEAETLAGELLAQVAEGRSRQEAADPGWSRRADGPAVTR